MSDALTATRPATVRLTDVTLTSGAAPPFGPITVVADAAGLRFWRPGDPNRRALPWHRVRRVRIDAGDGGTTVLVATVGGVHHLWAPGAEPARTAGALAAVAGAVPVTFRPPAGPATPEPATPEPATPATAAPAATAPAAPAAAAPAATAPAAPAAAAPTRSARSAAAAAPAWFLRLRPTLTVVLVLAVAAMVALVLAASAGAVHLGWLGGGGGRQIPPAH